MQLKNVYFMHEERVCSNVSCHSIFLNFLRIARLFLVHVTRLASSVGYMLNVKNNIFPVAL